MSAKDNTNTDGLKPLFRHASARQKAPPEVELAIRKETMEEWRQVTGRRKRKRRLYALAIAASTVLAVSVLSFNNSWKKPTTVTLQIASIDTQSGRTFIRGENEDVSRQRAVNDTDLQAGHIVRTDANSRLALDWLSGESLRIDESSELLLVSAHEIRLIYGRVYVDTQAADDSSGAFVIETQVGTVQHLGTQYMTAVSGQQLDVTVREGEVRIQVAAAETMAYPGERLSLGPSGAFQRTEVLTWGGDWEWVSEVTPAFRLDGVSAERFIQWAGRESGRKVIYTTESTRKLARETELRGSITLHPVRALELILQTSDLEALIEGGDILISERKGS